MAMPRQDKPESAGRSVTPSFVACLSALALLVFGCQTGDPRPGPGNEGTVPPATPPLPKINVRAVTTQPIRAECDRIFIYVVEATQSGATCQGYNFAPLYNDANATGRRLAETLPKCPAACQPRHLWLQRSVRVCENNKAQVVLEYGTFCPRDRPKPPGLPDPTPADLGNPDEELADPIPGGPTINETFQFNWATTPLACTPPDLLEIDFREPVKDCRPAQFEFGTFVDYARAQAVAFCQTRSCATGCDKLDPPRITGARWSCSSTGTRVDVRVWLQCCAPPP